MDCSSNPARLGQQPLAGDNRSPARVVFLFDIDNTLLDNDHIIEDLRRCLQAEVGEPHTRHYLEIFESLRAELGYADYLGALQRYRTEFPRQISLVAVSRFLINYPFANRLYPNSIDVLEYAKQFGPTVLLSDGDVVFQPHKADRSGLSGAADGRVLIYVHKELQLDDVQRRYPANHYVLVDDKLRILAAVKKSWVSRVTTIFVRQGHYALDPKTLATYPPADITINRIGDLLNHNLANFSPKPLASTA